MLYYYYQDAKGEKFTMQKICFDTSTVCSLFDNSTNTKEVVKLFDCFAEKLNSFQLFVSPIFSHEINFSPIELIDKIADIIETYNIAKLPKSQKTDYLVEIYLKEKVLTFNHYFDLSHIAYASIFSCDFFITCDIAHIARKRTIQLVQKINTEQNIFIPDIVTPSIFMEIQKWH